MQIAPLDHLWVRGAVSELDADKVKEGQKLKVVFPYSARRSTARSNTSTRRSIWTRAPRSSGRRSPTPEGKFKAGMFVRVLLEIPPGEGGP